MARRKRQRTRGSLLGPVAVVATALVVVLAGLGAASIMIGDSNSDSPSASAPSDHMGTADVDWEGVTPPSYVRAASRDVQTAYRFALDRPDVMMWMPCYCGCGQHSNHKDARHCFVKESTASGVLFDPHGASCGVCVGIALDVKTMTEEGRSLRDIRAFIDEEYGSVGGGTDTPLPPV